MKRDKTAIYQQMIVEHNKKPRNYGKLDPYTHSAAGRNPLCGDELDVYMTIDDDGRIADISFEGSGCAISKASASIMTVTLKGKTVDEAKHIFDRFHDMITGENRDAIDEPGMDKLAVFSGIWQYPSRVKCAGLAWHAMNGAMTHKHEITTE